MRITSLNLQGFIDWDTRKDEVVQYMQSIRSDIILFQEVVFLPQISPYNQVQQLNETLAYPYIHSSVTRLQESPVYENFREGLGVLSQFQIISTDTIVLKQAEGDRHNRIIQLIDVRRENENTLKIANIHFSLTEPVDYASAHLKETLEILAGRNETRIIVGDFNISDLEARAELWGKDYRLVTNVDYISFPGENKRIDYFLIPKAYMWREVLISGDGLSDHRAVTVEIESCE